MRLRGASANRGCSRADAADPRGPQCAGQTRAGPLGGGALKVQGRKANIVHSCSLAAARAGAIITAFDRFIRLPGHFGSAGDTLNEDSVLYG